MSRNLSRWLVLVCLLGIVSSERVDAQQVESPDDIAVTDSDRFVPRAFDQYVVRGGWITVCILIPLSILAVAMYIECALTIRRKTIVPSLVVQRLGDLLERGQYAEALQYAQEDRSVLSQVVHNGLVEARNGYSAMERAMEDAIEERSAKLSRKIEYLNLIGTVAPMLGLFGTVNGIIGMFVSISDAGGIPVMSRISADLGTALVATFWGLLVAIPALSVFALLRNRIDVLLAECATAVDKMMVAFKPQSNETPRPNVARAPASVVPAVASR